MLNTAHLFFPARFSVDDIRKALESAGFQNKDSYGIVSIPPDRHVRFKLFNVKDDPDLLESLQAHSINVDDLNKQLVWMEMSSAEKEGKLAVATCTKLLTELEGSFLIDENDRVYYLGDIIQLAEEKKGFYS